MNIVTSDQLPDDARRRQGAFFTPAIWVAEAHKSLDKVLGPNWRDECIVWDPAAGTGNLTRDYQFADLLISTLEPNDVQVIKDQGYNPGAEIFQYDFLNPEEPFPFFGGDNTNEIPDTAHERLKEAAKAGKRLVFLMNPPYGTANDAGAKGTSKAGIALTVVNGQMKEAKMGAITQQLYAQFMYQCNKVAEGYGFNTPRGGGNTVAVFSAPTFMSSGSFHPFRQWWYSQYSFQDAFMLQASQFDDVVGSWGISFTVWDSPGKTNPKFPLPCAIKDVPKGTFSVVGTVTKHIYNSNGRGASAWVRGPVRGMTGVDAPQMSSGLRVKEGPGYRGSLVPGAPAYLTNGGNSIYNSRTSVFWTSSCSSKRNGLSVTSDNFSRALALYGARKLVKETWITQKDEYLSPYTEGTPTYEQWVDDCHVFGLLHSDNNCTAMRMVQYKGKSWTIHNHFFWMAHSEALKALDAKETGNLYRDCKTHSSKDVFGNSVESTPDPYMASRLPNLNLSSEAQAVLDKLDALWLLSLPVREDYAFRRPELHLMAWDAGVYQLKHLWRDLFPTEWADLQDAFKVLSDKLRPGVYDHGFLLQ